MQMYGSIYISVPCMAGGSAAQHPCAPRAGNRTANTAHAPARVCGRYAFTHYFCTLSWLKEEHPETFLYMENASSLVAVLIEYIHGACWVASQSGPTLAQQPVPWS